jgi:transposase
MTPIRTALGTPFGQYDVPVSFRLKFGPREVGIRRDVRTRYYSVRPIMDCRVGMEAGHLEILLWRRWLITLSKAH